MKRLLFLGFVLFMAGCAEVQQGGNQTLPSPDFCEKDSDCVVKDVHNCCGYYPRCVNVDHEPDIEAVIQKCQEEGLVSVCGFPDITECGCIENTCESMQDGKIV